MVDRIKGMLLGLAMGDALGNTSEGMTPESRRRCRGFGTTPASRVYPTYRDG